MDPGIAADNLGDTMTVGALMECLGQYPPDMKVAIRVARMKVDESFQSADGSIHIEFLPALDCALDPDDVTFVSDIGLVMLMTGHQVLDT